MEKFTTIIEQNLAMKQTNIHADVAQTMVLKVIDMKLKAGLYDILFLS